MNYNTFVIQKTKSKKVELVTSSARRAASYLVSGYAIEVWNGNKRTERITVKDLRKERNPMLYYIGLEKEYIKAKQERATSCNLAKKKVRL